MAWAGCAGRRLGSDILRGEGQRRGGLVGADSHSIGVCQSGCVFLWRFGGRQPDFPRVEQRMPRASVEWSNADLGSAHHDRKHHVASHLLVSHGNHTARSAQAGHQHGI